MYYLFTPAGSHFIYERFIIQCFNLINKILLCVEYKPAKIPEMTKEPETLRAHQMKTTFFQQSTLTEICRKLVTHYFLLTQDELDMWDADPETFVNDEGGESWKYSLRVSCCGRVAVFFSLLLLVFCSLVWKRCLCRCFTNIRMY